MSATDPSQQNVATGGRRTVASGPPATSDPLAPKRICFYKSGDPQFSGYRAVISARTFKSFDALLDGLSRKVPLPFGVRTITTPRGTRPVLSLEDLEDGKSYLCSDRKRVKPIDLEAARKGLVPWNAALLATRGQQASQLTASRATRESLAAQRMSRTLTIFRNGDPSSKRTMVLQKASSQTFEALLRDISGVMQFPVVKVYTIDGRRLDGLEALLLCSSVVASSNEPFMSGSYSLQKPPQTSRSASHLEPDRLQPRPRRSKSLSRKNARNVSLSSETFLGSQVDDSMSENLFNPRSCSTVDTCGLACAGETGGSAVVSGALAPLDVDDIEKSCRINQDGSMTVEMKVRLNLKEEETIRWTTTLFRSSTTCWPGGGPASQETEDRRSLDPNNSPIVDPDDDPGWGGTTVNPSTRAAGARDPVEDRENEDALSLDAEKPRIRRVQTPGPRVVRKKQRSSEHVQSVSDSEPQGNEVGAFYSHAEQTTGSTRVEKCSSLIQQYQSHAMPKPRSAVGVNHSELHTAFRASRSAEVLQIQNSGREVTESVLHVYEQQSCFDSYFDNAEITSEHPSMSRTFSTDTTPRSSSNDSGRRKERPSVTSEPACSGESDSTPTSPEAAVPSLRNRNNLSSFTDNEAYATMEAPSEVYPQDMDCFKSHHGNKKPSGKLALKKASAVSFISDRTLVEGRMVDLRGCRLVKSTSNITHDRQADGFRAEQGIFHKIKKKGMRDRDDISKSPILLLNIKHQRESAKELNLIEGKSINEAKFNISTFAETDLLDIQPPLLVQKVLVKQWSMSEERREGAKENREMSESVSMPVLHSSPSAVHEYVEDWLEKIPSQDAPSSGEDAKYTDQKTKVQFQISSDSCKESEAECDIKSAPKEHSTCEHISDRTSSHSLTAGRMQLGPEHEQHIWKNTGISKSHVCQKLVAEIPEFKQHKSGEALVQTGAQMPVASVAAQGPQSKASLGQHCSSLQLINKDPQYGQTPCPEKSQCVLDFSSQVASIFGSPSKMLIAFLSVMSLREGIANLGRGQLPVKDSIVSEALQMVKALHKLASIENSNELKTGLSDLHRSASSELLRSWRSFQELRSHAGSEEAFGSPEHPVLSEAKLKDNREVHPYGFHELMKELAISGNLQRQISCLVMGEVMDDVKNEEPTEKSEVLNSFFESVTEERCFVDTVQGMGASDLMQSVAEDDITDFVGSIAEEVHDFTQSVPEKEIDNPEESILRKRNDGSVQEKEVNKLVQSVLVEGDDFAQSAPEEDTSDQALSVPANEFIGSDCGDYKSTEQHDISRTYAASINVDSRSPQCKHLTLDEAGRLKERGDHTGEPVISVKQEEDTTYVQRKTCLLQIGTTSKAFKLPPVRQLKEAESVRDDSEERVKTTELQTVSAEYEDSSFGAISRSVEIPGDLLEYIALILKSSSLAFSYDSSGNLRIESEGPCDEPVRGVPQYGQKQLPSPSMSDLSDYRETSESDRCSSRLSVELTSEGEGEGSGVQCLMNVLEGGNNGVLVETKKAEEYHAGGLSSNPGGRSEEMSGMLQGQSLEHTTPCMDDDISEGVLIDKGRWLLKENHLIRNSPPVPSGMYGNVETTSAETTQDDVSDNISCYSHPGSHRSPMAVLSSSELEELSKPMMPKCSYFNMSHGSDSEPFQDEPSEGSRKCFIGKRTWKKNELGVSPSNELHKTLARKCGSMSSFSSVEFKMADNKVHPQAGPSGSAPVEGQLGEATYTDSQMLKEQESLGGIHLLCGQHCPIL